MSEVTNRDLATMPLDQAINAYSPNFEAVLPPGISVDHFKRMVISAVNTNPDLRYADRRTFFNAALKCASDGVLPDGREAVLVPFRTKIKDKNGKEHYIDAVQYMIMIAGIRKRLRNSGDVKSAIAEVVYQNDHFHHTKGDVATIDHVPAGLDQDPGEVMGAYAIITLSNGEIIREVVRRSDIERARMMSRAKDGPAWTNWYDEMARKVALRRASKSAPSASELHRLEQMLEREENAFDSAPPPPRPEDFIQSPPAEEPEISPSPSEEPQQDLVVVELVDTEGVVTVYEDPAGAYKELCELLFTAAKISQGTLEGVWESNDVARMQLGELEPAAIGLPNGASIEEALQRVYESLLPEEPLEPPEELSSPPAPPEPPEPESPPPAPPPQPTAPIWRETMASSPQPRRRGRPPKVRPEAQEEPPSYIVDVPDVVVEMEPRRAAPAPEETEDDIVFARGNLSTTTYHTRLGAYIRKKRQLTGAEKWSPDKWKEFRKRNAKDLAETKQVMSHWFTPIDNLIKAGEEGR